MLIQKEEPFSIVVGLPNSLWKFKRLNAFVVGCFIFHNKNETLRDDIVKHELVHINQFYRHPFKQPFGYLTNANRRLEYECEAYAKQILFLLHKDYDIDNFDLFLGIESFKVLIDSFSNVIYTSYKLNMDESICRDRLLHAVKKATTEYRINVELYNDIPFWADGGSI